MYGEACLRARNPEGDERTQNLVMAVPGANNFGESVMSVCLGVPDVQNWTKPASTQTIMVVLSKSLVLGQHLRGIA